MQSKYIRFIIKDFKRFENILSNCLIALIIIILGIATFNSFSNGDILKLDMIAVQNFRIPSKNLFLLKRLAGDYDIDFAELLSIYAIDNNFFKDSKSSVKISDIEYKYAVNYKSILKKYDRKSIVPYYNMFKSIFAELEYFPITLIDSNNYMLSEALEQEIEGIEITNKSLSHSNISVVSMTDGIIKDIGFDKNDGMYVSIVTQNNNVYYYANLDNLNKALSKNRKISSGQYIGQMGKNQINRNKENLIIRISPAFKKIPFINPYPFLKYIENNKLD